MQFLSYLLVAAIAYPLSVLPFWVLYRFSDVFFLLIYYVFGYRKKVVFNNLRNSFPNKSEEEIRTIAKQFYRHLCDILVEDIKLLSLSQQEVLRRCVVENPELLNKVYDKGSSAIMTLGHTGNWEMSGLMASVLLKHHSIAIYRKLSNPYFDQLAHRLRGRFGLELVPQSDLRGLMRKLKEPGNVFHFITDQTPWQVQHAHWMDFLNQDTPVFMGTERVARQTGLPVFYIDVKKVKRGHYHIKIIPVTDDPKALQPGELTEMHTRLLEQSIRQQPFNWLWSHRRWKRKRPADMKATAGVY